MSPRHPSWRRRSLRCASAVSSCCLIEGGPRVLLFDTGSCMNRLDEWKTDLWNVAGIPTPPNDSETNDTIVFGYLVVRLRSH